MVSTRYPAPTRAYNTATHKQLPGAIMSAIQTAYYCPLPPSKQTPSAVLPQNIFQVASVGQVDLVCASAKNHQTRCQTLGFAWSGGETGNGRESSVMLSRWNIITVPVFVVFAKYPHCRYRYDRIATFPGYLPLQYHQRTYQLLIKTLQSTFPFQPAAARFSAPWQTAGLTHPATREQRHRVRRL